MASGFSGGGPDFYNTTGFGARSTTMNMNMNNNNNNNPSQQQQQQQQQSPYRSQIFLDPSQISNRTTPNFKRTLSEFQSQYHHHQQQQQHHHHHQNPALANLFLRSVKPRMYQNISSPISPLSPIDFSPPEIPSLLSQQQQHQRFGMPPLQQLRPQPTIQQITNPTLSGVPYMNSVQQQQQQQNRVQPQDSEKKMMNQLLALEKQLLDDNDDEEGDAVSVVTNTNSEWSETIQNLISVSSPKPISTSPTSSTTSSSSSSSTVASSPASGCSKQTLMEAASAISEGKTDVANEILTRVGQVSNPMGNSEQKLMEYLLMALKSRGNSFDNPPLLAELYSKEHVASTQLLYDLSPCFKLGFMAANHAILDAILDQQPNSSSSNNNNNNNNKKFHVVDFDIGQGGQYVNLVHALSARQNGKQQPPSVVKITAVADNNEGEERLRLRFVGDKLCEVAKKVGVSLKFNVVVVSHKLGDLSRDSLGCEPDELLAVNFAFKLYRMPDESVSTENPRDELLRRVKWLSPRVVTLVEQEMNTNTAPFMARVGEVCSYYGALFDSIESVARDNPDRVKVEEGLGRKLANSVACEGRERVERCEVFGKWRARMGMAGFELKPLSQNVAESMRARLSSGNGVNPGFTVKEENGGVCFGWMGRTLTVASAWR